MQSIEQSGLRDRTAATSAHRGALGGLGAVCGFLTQSLIAGGWGLVGAVMPICPST